mgnify:CR=1 FL=1
MEPPIPRTSSPPETRTKKLYALKFISGKYQGGEFPLPEEGEIVIGRSSDLDMVLVEDMVSRRHAKISSTDAEVYIQDMGSTNGTFVGAASEDPPQAAIDAGDRREIASGEQVYLGAWTRLVIRRAADGRLDIVPVVVGFVGVGSDQEQRPAQPLGDECGQNRRSGSPQALGRNHPPFRRQQPEQLLETRVAMHGGKQIHCS